jgi:hypothetical protein
MYSFYPYCYVAANMARVPVDPLAGFNGIYNLMIYSKKQI